MEQRRIILTNLNPSVYRPKYLPTFLSELVINSLLCDQVLIREGDLITNKNITEYLCTNPESFEVFKELLSVGAVKVLHLRPESYPKDLKFDPQHQPLRARAEDHSRRRSFKGRPWKPHKSQCQLYDRLDNAIRESPDYKDKSRRKFAIQRRFPKHNDFAAVLQDILLPQHRERLRKRKLFSQIDDDLADNFSDFCSSPEAWIRFLHRKGVKKPLLGPEGRFYRTAAYQCLQVFKHNPKGMQGMQRLVESTYAACDCDREEADGRYGRSALAELPFVFESDEEEQEAAETVVKMEVVPAGPPMKIGVAPGIGEVLAATREHETFREMQKALRSLGSAVDTEKSFKYPWQNLCSLVADNWARKMVRREKVDIRFGKVFVGIYLATRLRGFVAFHGREGFDWPVVVDGAVINRIEHWVPELSRTIRAITKIPAVYKQLVNAVTLRCERVTLRSKPSRRAPNPD